MSLLLLTSLLYVGVGCLEWFLALRRTLAVSNGETTLLCVLVFVENIVGLFVLSNFVQTGNWMIAISYSLGGSLGALSVMKMDKKKSSSDKSIQEKQT